MTDLEGNRPDLPILPYERRPAHVRKWDPRTIEVAATIAAMVRRRRPGLVVEHIGSTAVPGLPGKGIVDLSLEVEAEQIPGVVQDLLGLGFGPQPGPDPWPPTRPMLVGAVQLDGDEFRLHVHVQPIGGDMPRDLAFRDALRRDPELTRQYADLKTQITGGSGVDALRYTHSKTTWILGVYKALGFRVPAIRPPATIGILGGGGLSRMIGLAARELGYRVAVLDPDPACPASDVADRLEIGRPDDLDAARRLAAGCAAITSALDAAPLDVIRALDDPRLAIRPGPYALRLSQDREAQLPFLEANGASLGSPPDDLVGAELSITVARGVDGVVHGYPVSRIRSAGGAIVEASTPAGIPPEAAASALLVATNLATGMGLVGLLSVRFSLPPDGAIVVDRLVPRPDESGLWTTDAAVTSLFEQGVRAICGLPLGSGDLTAPAAATVVLPVTGAQPDGDVRGVEVALEAPEVHVHLADARFSGRGWTAGHVTATGPTPEAALETARAAAARIRWAGAREADR